MTNEIANKDWIPVSDWTNPVYKTWEIIGIELQIVAEFKIIGAEILRRGTIVYYLRRTSYPQKTVKSFRDDILLEHP